MRIFFLPTGLCVFSFALFCLSFQVFGSDQSEIVILLGKGQAKVSSFGLDIPDPWRERLETELLMDRQLADRVISSAQTEIKLRGDILDSLEMKLATDPESALVDLIDLIHLQIRGSHRDRFEAKETENLPPSPSLVVPFDSSFRFFMDSDHGVHVFDFFDSGFWKWGFRLVKLLFLLLITFVLVKLAPDFFLRVQNELKQDRLSASLWGFLYSITYLPLSLLLVISILGILLLPLQFIFTLYLLIVGCAAVMKLLIENFCQKMRLTESMVIFVGIVLFEMIGWIPIFGFCFHMLVSLLGVGCTFKVIWGRLWSHHRPTSLSDETYSLPSD
ncbi:MAG: hypothetical protein KDD35_01790 [Bdellovibrionales bacterium]|nr:hypothetical protein [Bdellovibrionales bacterium]